MQLKLLLKRSEPCRMDKCPNGLVVCKEKLMLKTPNAFFHLKDGEAEFLVLPEETVAPITYEFI